MRITRRPPTRRFELTPTDLEQLDPAGLFYDLNFGVPAPNQVELILQEMLIPGSADPIIQDPTTNPHFIVEPLMAQLRQGVTFWDCTDVALDAVGVLTFTFDPALILSGGELFMTGPGLQAIFAQTGDFRTIPMRSFTL